MLSDLNMTNSKKNTELKETLSPPLGRHDALSLFIRLQSQGYMPWMVEENTGHYRVSHNELRA